MRIKIVILLHTSPTSKFATDKSDYLPFELMVLPSQTQSNSCVPLSSLHFTRLHNRVWRSPFKRPIEHYRTLMGLDTTWTVTSVEWLLKQWLKSFIPKDYRIQAVSNKPIKTGEEPINCRFRLADSVTICLKVTADHSNI